jgi:protein-S-isoprenylcysteine O-methyltransferase Ste14
MVAMMPADEPKRVSLSSRIKNLLGVGAHLLLLGLSLEGLTLVARQWVSFPIPLSIKTQVLITVPCVAICLAGMIWFNITLKPFKVHLLDGKYELVTQGPFAYVRHPLYATLLIALPPLFVVWFADLIFCLPWALILVASHYIVRIEERGLIKLFGEDYERYRRHVPALLPYKGDGGRRYRENLE